MEIPYSPHSEEPVKQVKHGSPETTKDTSENIFVGHDNISANSSCIHEKLSSANSHWGWRTPVNPHAINSEFMLNTCLIPDAEFAIYKRIGDYFVLVDFFKIFDEACDEAKEIIEKNDLRKSIKFHNFL